MTIKVAFPATSNELRAGGYLYDNDSRCRGCGIAIEWWITPQGNKMPMTVEKVRGKGDVRQTHFASCPAAEDFRR